MTTVEVLQVQAELDWMVDLFRELEPRRVLEIGVHEGGTLKAWMENAPDDTQFVAVDLELHMFEWTGWLHGLQILRPVKGSSQDDRVKRSIQRHGPFDWAFIDGDHHLEAVESDVELVLPLIRSGGVLVLHDIANLPHEGPAEVLERLKVDYEVHTCIVDTDVDAPHGVGAVFL